MSGRGYHHLRAAIQQAGQMSGSLYAPMKHGLVSSYDPKNILVKVRLMPQDIETGWLPIKLLMAGSGFGVYCGPSVDDEAVVIFSEGDPNSGVCIGFLGNLEDQPPTVQSGEIQIIAKGAAASIKMDTAGNIASAGTWVHTGTMKVTGNTELDAALDVKGATHLEGTAQIDGKTTAAEVDATVVKIGGVTVVAP